MSACYERAVQRFIITSEICKGPFAHLSLLCETLQLDSGATTSSVWKSYKMVRGRSPSGLVFCSGNNNVYECIDSDPPHKSKQITIIFSDCRFGCFQHWKHTRENNLFIIFVHVQTWWQGCQRFFLSWKVNPYWGLEILVGVFFFKQTKICVHISASAK